jgi:FkbM family methyltransferase
MKHAAHGAADLVKAVWTHPENRQRKLRAVARLLAWQCWQRLVRRPWTIRLAGGRRLRVYPHSYSATEALYFGLGEARDMRFTLDFLAPGDVFVDVGANVGVYSLLASSIPDVNIEAFEPSPAAFSRLTENVRLNRLEARVTMHRSAVGDVDGVAHLTQGRDCWNHLTSASDSDAIDVPIVRLDATLPSSTRRVSLMKIDVEGREAAVLAGATATLRADHPALIVEGDWEKVAPIVEPLGYVPFDYDIATRTLTASRVRRGNNLLLLAEIGDARRRVSRRSGISKRGSRSPAPTLELPPSEEISDVFEPRRPQTMVRDELVFETVIRECGAEFRRGPELGMYLHHDPPDLVQPRAVRLLGEKRELGSLDIDLHEVDLGQVRDDLAQRHRRRVTDRRILHPRPITAEDARLRSKERVNDLRAVCTAIQLKIGFGKVDHRCLRLNGDNVVSTQRRQDREHADVAAEIDHDIAGADVETRVGGVHAPAVDLSCATEVLAGEADRDAVKTEPAHAAGERAVGDFEILGTRDGRNMAQQRERPRERRRRIRRAPDPKQIQSQAPKSPHLLECKSIVDRGVAAVIRARFAMRASSANAVDDSPSENSA